MEVAQVDVAYEYGHAFVLFYSIDANCTDKTLK